MANLIQLEMQEVRKIEKDTMEMKELSTKGLVEMKEMSKCLEAEVDEGL